MVPWILFLKKKENMSGDTGEIRSLKFINSNAPILILVLTIVALLCKMLTLGKLGVGYAETLSTSFATFL